MATAIFSPYKANEGGVAYPRDASFSSYLDTTERDFVRSLAESIKNPSPTREIPTLRKHVGRNNVSRAQRSGELGVFGAERYFNETINSDSPPLRKVNGDKGSAHHRHHRRDKYKRDDSLERKSSRSNITTTTTSLKSPTPSLKSSQGSFNNQIGLLLPKKGFVGHKIFSGFQCKGSCFDKKSINTTNTHQEVQSSPKSYQRNGNGNGHTKNRFAHQEHFAFPIIDTASLSLDHDKSNDSMDVFGFHQLKNQEKEQNFDTKYSIIAWNALPNSNINTPFLAFPLRNKTSPCNTERDDEDACSDASSDLFEIENLSGVHDIQTSSPYHEPSEGSIEWSIATASEADNVSCLSDDDHKTSITIERRKVHNKSSTLGGIYLGCTNDKAVDIVGN